MIMPARLKAQVWLAAAAILAAGLDQWTKALVKANMALYDSIEVVGDFFKITYIQNTGIAFGIFHGAQGDGRKYLLLGLSLLALGFLVYLFVKSKKTVLDQLSVGFILGGAAGNLFDRIVHRSVVDFCDFGIGQARWFTFNLADCAIVLGLMLLVIQAMIDEKRKKSAGPQEPPTRGAA
jgi:signal peptidase II